MKILRIAFVIIAGLSAVSCTMSESEFNTVHTMLEGSASARRAVVEKCVSDNWSKSDRKNLAILMDVPAEKTSKLACQRLTSALANGRLKYADMKASTPTPNLIRILQGR